MLTARDQYAQAMAVLTAAREAQLVDRCQVTRPARRPGKPVLDDDGDVITPAGTVVHTDLPCTISAPTRQPGNADATGDTSGVPNVRQLKVLNSAELHAGDVVDMTVTPFSPGLVGDRFVVLGEEERTFATCRRYAVRGSSWLPAEA